MLRHALHFLKEKEAAPYGGAATAPHAWFIRRLGELQPQHVTTAHALLAAPLCCVKVPRALTPAVQLPTKPSAPVAKRQLRAALH